MWGWIGKIAGLSKKVTVWLPQLDDTDGPKCVASVDGIDNNRWEVKHPTLPKNTGLCSFKVNHADCNGKLPLQCTSQNALESMVHAPVGKTTKPCWKKAGF